MFSWGRNLTQHPVGPGGWPEAAPAKPAPGSTRVSGRAGSVRILRRLFDDQYDVLVAPEGLGSRDGEPSSRRGSPSHGLGRFAPPHAEPHKPEGEQQARGGFGDSPEGDIVDVPPLGLVGRIAVLFEFEERRGGHSRHVPRVGPPGAFAQVGIGIGVAR